PSHRACHIRIPVNTVSFLRLRLFWHSCSATSALSILSTSSIQYSDTLECSSPWHCSSGGYSINFPGNSCYKNCFEGKKMMEFIKTLFRQEIGIAFCRLKICFFTSSAILTDPSELGGLQSIWNKS